MTEAVKNLQPGLEDLDPTLGTRQSLATEVEDAERPVFSSNSSNCDNCRQGPNFNEGGKNESEDKGCCHRTRAPPLESSRPGPPAGLAMYTYRQH